MGTRTETVVTYRKNPNFGQPGEPEMLPGETTTFDVTTAPVPVSATLFQSTCETGLGGGATGRARFGAIIRAMESSNDDEIYSVSKVFAKSVTFDKAKTSAFLSLLVSKGVANLTSQERTAILAAWPEA